MGTYIRATAFIAIAASASAAWGQQDLYDPVANKSVGKYAGDSVIISRNGTDPVRIYTDADWDYGNGKPSSSGLTWKYVPLYSASPNCSPPYYISTSPTEPKTPSGSPPGTGPAYTPPAYGSHYLVATWKGGTNWYVFYSAKNPTYQQVNIQSQYQYDGSCAQKYYPSMWVTPFLGDAEPLNIYGTPPFYVK